MTANSIRSSLVDDDDDDHTDITSDLDYFTPLTSFGVDDEPFATRPSCARLTCNGSQRCELLPAFLPRRWTTRERHPSQPSVDDEDDDDDDDNVSLLLANVARRTRARFIEHPPRAHPFSFSSSLVHSRRALRRAEAASDTIDMGPIGRRLVSPV